MKAPPAPARLDRAPMPAATPKSEDFAGSSRPERGARATIIRVAAVQVKTPRTAASARPESADAICGPTNEPSTMPGAIAQTTPQITPPRRACARADEAAVNIIVAVD